MINPMRGEIWMTRLDPVVGREQAKTRPCLVVSANGFNRSAAELVIVAPITSKQKKVSFHVRIVPDESGLEVESFIMPEHIRSVSIQRCTKCIGIVFDQTLAQVEEKIKLLLDLE